jgi:hypothetical protein
MDEEKAMTQAGETAGKAVGTGLRTLKRQAAKAGQTGADVTAKAAAVAEQKLAERGLAPQRLSEALAENAGIARDELVKSTRRTRKRLAKSAKQARKDLQASAEVARKQAKKAGKKGRKQATASARQALTRVDKKVAKVQAKANKRVAKLTGSRRRRWPLVLGGLAVVGVGAVLASRSRQAQNEQPPVEPAPVLPLDGADRQSTNGKAPSGTAKPSDASRN